PRGGELPSERDLRGALLLARDEGARLRDRSRPRRSRRRRLHEAPRVVPQELREVPGEQVAMDVVCELSAAQRIVYRLLTPLITGAGLFVPLFLIFMNPLRDSDAP